MSEPRRARRRSLHLTDELLRAYSRRGNFHSDPETARRAGLPGGIAQGMQVAGPAYGLLLDEWGDDFLARGELELRFVGMVLAGQTVTAEVTPGVAAGESDQSTEAGQRGDTADVAVADHATIEVRVEPDGTPVVVGTARRLADQAENH